MKRISIVCFFMLLFLWTKGFGAEDSSTKPEDNYLPYFITYSVFPLEKGLTEVIVQPQYIQDDDSSLLFLYPQIYYGVTDEWFVYFNFTPYAILSEKGVGRNLSHAHTRKKGSASEEAEEEVSRRTSGLGDCDMGAQYSWMYINKSTFSAAVGLNIHIPTADINKNITDGFLRYDPFLLLAKDFIHSNWRTQFFTQIGFSLVQRLKKHSNPEDDDPAAHDFIWNSGVAERSEKINFSVELAWTINTWNNNGEDNELYVVPGVYVQATKNVALGLGVPIGLTPDSAHYQIIGNLLVDIDPPKTADNGNSSNNKLKVPNLTPEKIKSKKV